MKKLFLLLDEFTYLPVPKKLTAPKDELPSAMRYLPVLGLICGLVLFLCARSLRILPPGGSAAVMVGMMLLLGGGKLLRPLMTTASGMTNDIFSADNGRPLHPENEKELTARSWRYYTTRSGLAWGGVWVITIYIIYLLFLALPGASYYAFIIGPVFCFWLMCWAVYYFKASGSAKLHREFSRRDMLISSLITLMTVIPFSCFALWMSMMIAFFGIYLFAYHRLRSAGGLDESCYGAICGWAQLLFLLAWFVFDRFGGGFGKMLIDML